MQVAETATQIFITGGDRANVAGIVLAGSAEFKNELSESDIFDPRLKAIVLAVVDVSYGTRFGRGTPIGIPLSPLLQGLVCAGGAVSVGDRERV
jgi:hypothetical protein